MENETNYTPNWDDAETQCKKCQCYQHQGGKNACTPPGKTFDQAIEEYGEISPNGHCNYFKEK